MITIKNINTRIQNKHDIENNWLKAINFIPKDGEIIIYDIDENYTYPRLKIGNGIDTINTLPFMNKIDSTLTMSNQVADAKTVGDALKTKQPVGDYAYKSDISTHNTATDSHDDIRQLIGEKVYAQSDEPVDAPEGSAWIDLDEEPSSGGTGSGGKDGISATHSWDGTILTITSASGTSSADLKGEKGDSPIRGTDYWTDSDKAEIKAYVDEAILGGAW